MVSNFFLLSSGAVPTFRASFGVGVGAIVLDDVRCVGNEISIFNCSRATVENCNHFEDAGVRCAPRKSSDTIAQSLPLICTCFNTEVISPYPTLQSSHHFLSLSPLSLPLILPLSFSSSFLLFSLSLSLLSSLLSSLPLSLVVCHDGDLRLVGGTTPDQGRLEVCMGEVWGTVCDDSFGVVDANVVCRQLNYSSFSKQI